MMDGGAVSRRGFMGGLGAAMGMLALPRDLADWTRAHRPERLDRPFAADDYDSYAKLAFNENPYGPPASVMEAMQHAFKYANRYGYPDPGLLDALSALHGVPKEMLVTSSGSGELLEAMSLAFLAPGKKVLGSDPSYNEVYSHVLRIHGEAIKVPLKADATQDLAAITRIARERAGEIGFIYLCNPNNPTGRTIPAREIDQLLAEIPKDIPVLIDEAYHHLVDDPSYATSVPYALAGRPVVVTRTFSKIAALAGIRLGYAVAPKAVGEQLRLKMTGTVNALARYAGAAALKDTASQAKVREVTLALRRQTTAALQARGFAVIPSETNFFMVHIKKPVTPVIAAFREKGVLVGRPFPPMTEHLRVSVGTPEEMQRFLAAWPAAVG